MINNNNTTSFYDECMKDDYPYRVIFDYRPIWKERYHYLKAKDRPEENIENRFEILDISPKKIKSEELKVEKISKTINNLVEKSNSIWKEPEPISISLREEDLIEALEEDFKRHLLECLAKIKEKTQINNRFEILDL